MRARSLMVRFGTRAGRGTGGKFGRKGTVAMVAQT